jgi:hypothetical protein
VKRLKGIYRPRLWLSGTRILHGLVWRFGKPLKIRIAYTQHLTDRAIRKARWPIGNLMTLVMIAAFLAMDRSRVCLWPAIGPAHGPAH